MNNSQVIVAPKQIKIGEGASTLVLLVILLLSVTGSIETAEWTEGLGVLSFSVLGGMMIGYLLAHLPARGRVTHPLMIAVAAWGAWLFTSTLLPTTLTLQEKLVLLAERFGAWMLRLLAGGESGDSIIFVIQASFVMWAIGYAAAWFVYRRHQVWGAILPTGTLLVINLFYALPQSGIYFGLFLVSALLLLVRLNLHALERWWRQASIGYSSDISFDFLYYGTLSALVLLFASWAIPTTIESSAWVGILEPIQAPWRDVEEQFSRVFKNLRAVMRPAPTVFFGSSLAMGGPVRLGDRLVMEVKSNAGEYWRAATYDKFDGINWTSTYSTTLLVGANDSRLDLRRYGYRIEITQTIKLHLADPNNIYAAAEPIRFDIPTQIHYTPASSGETREFDLAFVSARRPLRDGDAYVALSTVSAAYEDLLRADSTAYPEWVKSKYLQLPDELPNRVRGLAAQLTQSDTNPYDKASTLENYLRTHITYNERVDAPPPNRDGVDYTLFDRPEGYCNYYASAMVVMARAVGIPARVASGYTAGEYKDGAFQVIESNAHSWVEVYFPNYGWIRFEPTASKPEIARPKKPETAPTLPETEEAAAEARRRQQREREFEDEKDFTPGSAAPLAWWEQVWSEPRNLALTIVGILTLIVIGMVGTRQWQSAVRLARMSPAARAYEKMIARSRWVGIVDTQYATPLERAQKIAGVLMRAENESKQIATLYMRERFGSHLLDQDENSVLTAAWRKWKEEWWRGFVAQMMERFAAPFRAQVENARRFKRRIERM